MSPDLLEKYVVPGAFHNSAERYDPPKCHPHTREAVLKRIMLWVDDPANEAQIMWMFGPAGAGKSAIAQSIAEMCFQQGKLAASFFFSRNASGRNNETRFISTLVYQLVLAIPEIQDAVNKALQADRLLLSRSLHVQAQSLITNPLNGLLASSSENGFQNPRPRLIIVDGLDECGQAKNHAMFSTFSQQSPGTCHTLCYSWLPAGPSKSYATPSAKSRCAQSPLVSLWTTPTNPTQTLNDFFDRNSTTSS